MTLLNIKLLGDGVLNVQIKEIIGEENIALNAQKFYVNKVIDNMPQTIWFTGIQSFYDKPDGIYILNKSNSLVLIGEKI